MPSKPRLLEQVLDAYREGDLDECIRLVRTLVEAAPQATAPRQLLAALFASTHNGRLALAHYRRLLPQSVTRGEVIRAIAFQKQIDVYEHAGALAPGRWHALQKQLREKGLPFLSEAPGASGRPWTEAQLLALPRAWFERIAAETRFEIIGLEHRVLDVEVGTVWEVLAGRMRWSFALADGRASAEALAAEGDAVHVDPALARTASVTLVPELPVEVLRFEAGLARDLRLALSAGLHVSSSALPGLTSETRAMLPIRPRRREDLDEMPRAPLPNGGTEPLRLPPPTEDAQTPAGAPGDGAGWVEFGVLSLSGPPAEAAGPGDAAMTLAGGEGSGPGATGSVGDVPASDRAPAAPSAPAAGDAETAGERPSQAASDEGTVAAGASGSDGTRLPAIPERERMIELPPAEVEPAAASARADDETTGEPVGAHTPVAGEVMDARPTAEMIPFTGPDAPEPSAVAPTAPASEAEVIAGPTESAATTPIESPLDEAVTAGSDEAPVDAAEVYLLPTASDPIAGSIGEREAQVERRRHPRVSVSLASRLALLRLTGSRVTPVEGRLGDLSTSGFSIRFANGELGPSRGALADAVVAVDLDLPGPHGGLRVAAQVRWLEVDEAHDEARLGIEFVLLTEPDRRRIAGTLARAALAARDQERKAA